MKPPAPTGRSIGYAWRDCIGGFPADNSSLSARVVSDIANIERVITFNRLEGYAPGTIGAIIQPEDGRGAGLKWMQLFPHPPIL